MFLGLWDDCSIKKAKTEELKFDSNERFNLAVITD